MYARNFLFNFAVYMYWGLQFFFSLQLPGPVTAVCSEDPWTDSQASREMLLQNMTKRIRI